jgi:hypothetical protein
MLATLLIWLSAAVAVLALADLLLSKAQKDWLSNAVIKIWSVIDEAKAWSFADWLKNPRARWWFAEYPKGPILALSALFGGVCALIKAFG